MIDHLTVYSLCHTLACQAHRQLHNSNSVEMHEVNVYDIVTLMQIIESLFIICLKALSPCPMIACDVFRKVVCLQAVFIVHSGVLYFYHSLALTEANMLMLRKLQAGSRSICSVVVGPGRLRL